MSRTVCDHFTPEGELCQECEAEAAKWREDRRKKLRGILSGNVAFCQTSTDLRYDTPLGFPVTLNSSTINALVAFLVP